MWSQTKLQEIKLDLLNKWPFPGEKSMQRMLMLICPVPVAKVQGGKDRQASLAQIDSFGSEKSVEHLANNDPADCT